MRRRILIFAAGGFALLVCCVICFVVQIKLRVSSYDSAFQKVQLGQHSEDVIELLGAPHEVSEWRSIPQGQFRLYCYQLKSPITLPVKWAIGIDPSGIVVTKHRDDDGC